MASMWKPGRFGRIDLWTKKWLYNEPYVFASFLIGGAGCAIPAFCWAAGIIDAPDYGEAVMCPIRDLQYDSVHAKFGNVEAMRNPK